MLALSVSAHAELSPAENAARLRQLDRNKDGVLEADEVDLGLWYRANQGKIDLKNPPAAEDIALKAKKNAVFQLLRAEFDADHGNKPSYPFEELRADVDFRLPKAPAVPKEPSGPSSGIGTGPITPPGRFLLRRSLDQIPATFSDTDVSATASGTGADKLADQGALFSYGRHFPTSTDEWIAEGVLAYEQPFNGGLFGPTSIGRWLFSLGFSRVDFSGDISKVVPKKLSMQFRSGESNLAQLGATYESLVNWPQGILGFTGSSLRFNALWKTDWDFESSIPTGELEWTFYNGKVGLGSFNTEWDLLWWRIDASVHTDGGHVASDGKWTKSIQGDTFGHIGPKLSLTIMPFPRAPMLRENPIVIKASFAQYEGFTDESREIRAVTADCAWYLRKPGSGRIGIVDPGIALTLSYRNYDDVENQQADNTLILGLAIAF